MRPVSFTYLAPDSAEEALAQLASYAGNARLLAGGQSLIPLLNLRISRPAALVDLGRCSELAYLRREGDWLASGPMTRQVMAEHAALVRENCPLLGKALRHLGPPAVRNRATIGGTLAHADRVAELPGVALALGAEFIAQGPGGRRVIPAEKFFRGDLTNALDPDEMLREIRFPTAPPSSGSAFVEACNRHHDLMLVGIAAQLEFGVDGSCSAARIAAAGVQSTPVRLRQTEARLVRAGQLDEAAILEAARLSLEDVEPEGDLHASAAYRRRVMVGLVERALRQAAGDATGGSRRGGGGHGHG